MVSKIGEAASHKVQKQLTIWLSQCSMHWENKAAWETVHHTYPYPMDFRVLAAWPSGWLANGDQIGNSPSSAGTVKFESIKLSQNSGVAIISESASRNQAGLSHHDPIARQNVAF